MATLQELGDALRAQLEAIDPETGEIADSLALDIAAESFERKIEACAYARRAIQADVAAVGELAKHYAARAKATAARVDRLDEYVARCLAETGLRKVQTASATVYLQADHSVNVSDVAQLPPQYVRQKPLPAPEPDKVAIKAALKAGDTVPGATLVTTDSLRFK